MIVTRPHATLHGSSGAAGGEPWKSVTAELPTDGRPINPRLLPPTLGELAKFTQLSRKVNPATASNGEQSAPYRSLRWCLAPQVFEDLVTRYLYGEKTPALRPEFVISDSGVHDLLRAEAVILRGHAMTSQDAQTLVQLCERGLTITQMVAQVGYSKGTIQRVHIEHGFAKRSELRESREVQCQDADSSEK